MGCDLRVASAIESAINFNPRTHRGVRLSLTLISLTIYVFQSTHPSWGATAYLVFCINLSKISIHAPIVGCDDGVHKRKINYTVISIHAPIVGCDFIVFKLIYQQTYFNPRTHRGVRQLSEGLLKVTLLISIHAPIVGCDVI